MALMFTKVVAIFLLLVMVPRGGWSRGDAVCSPKVDGTWKNFVTDFGAQTDGVTNSSPAVNAWVTYAIAHDGSKLYVPPGNYVLSGTNAIGNGINNMIISGYGASFGTLTIGKIGDLREDTTN